MVRKVNFLFWVVLAIFMAWGCDNATGPKAKGSIDGDVLSIEVEQAGNSYTFSVNLFKKDNYPVFEDGKVNAAAQGVWDVALLRWGFRKKSIDGATENPIQWVQTSKGGENPDDPIVVSEDQKYIFAPEGLPSVLMREDVIDLEVYLLLKVGEFELTTRVDLPANFKSMFEDTDNDGIPDYMDADATGGADSDGDNIDDAYDDVLNSPPILAWDEVNSEISIKNFYFYVDTTGLSARKYRIKVDASDPENDALRYTWYQGGEVIPSAIGSDVEIQLVSPTTGKTESEVLAMTVVERTNLDIKVSVTDSYSRPVEKVVRVMLNRLPEVAISASRIVYGVGTQPDFTVTATDWDSPVTGDPFRYEWSFQKPGGSTWNPWNPTLQSENKLGPFRYSAVVLWGDNLAAQGAVGGYVVRVRATDDLGAIGEATVTIVYSP